MGMEDLHFTDNLLKTSAMRALEDESCCARIYVHDRGWYAGMLPNSYRLDFSKDKCDAVPIPPGGIGKVCSIIDQKAGGKFDVEYADYDFYAGKWRDAD